MLRLVLPPAGEIDLRLLPATSPAGWSLRKKTRRCPAADKYLTVMTLLVPRTCTIREILFSGYT